MTVYNMKRPKNILGFAIIDGNSEKLDTKVSGKRFFN
jgi:hypothetical protein